jgi:uncharacterized protein
MIFEWDESKRIKTLETRGLDFADADLFFDGRPIISLPSQRGDELRWKTTAMIGGDHTLVWAWRGKAVRVISMRRAHGDEEKGHRAIHER